jgi:hypothetical protein
MMLRRVRSRPGAEDHGYIAVLTALLALVIMAMAAFAVDVGNWYLTAQEEQRAADAAALAGVPSLPVDTSGAFATAKNFAAANGFTDGQQTVSVVAGLDGQPTRLKVTVTKTVGNYFGTLLGLSKTTISRSAVADYAGPVPMGSPCNEFGNDPESTGFRSSNCANTGQFWANVGSPAATKVSGDAYQDNNCSSSPVPDNCAGGVNSDYETNGYFYTVNLTADVNNLVVQAFDPALISVGDACDNPTANLSGAVGTRYEKGSSSSYCTGDILYGGSVDVSTRFTLREQVPTSNPWDPLSYPAVAGCTNTYAGYHGDLSNPANYSNYVKAVFRQWATLCTIPSAKAGTYMMQVQTNGLGLDTANGHNRFGIRAYGSTSGAKDSIAIAGYQRMAMYANLPSATTLFYLARVPSGAAGQILNVRLFDIGDSTGPGTVQILAPLDSGVAFTNCVGNGPASGSFPTCSLTASSSFNGKWETVSVPIPTNYTCNDLDQTKCWVKLQYSYGAGNKPSDTTSWTANIEGDPVRLVK